MDFDFYKINEGLRQISFFQVPDELCFSERYKDMSSNAKLLYGYMLRRLFISEKNGWVDEDNNIYIIVSIEDTMRFLNISNKTAVAVQGELREKKLILQQKRGQGKATYTYPLKIQHEPGCSGIFSKPDSEYPEALDKADKQKNMKST